MNNSIMPYLGRLFMVGLPGTKLDESTLHLITKYKIHNFILFRRNVRDKTQLTVLCSELRRTCKERDLPSPLISIDQEGGSVSRLPPPFTQFPDAQALAESNKAAEKFLNYARVSARELLKVGINMNLAPVLDVCARGQKLIMERRSIGDDPEQVAEFGSLIIKEMQGRGVAACGKHFPGLGTAEVDPHRELPIVHRSISEIRSVDLVPFQRAIASDVSSIMTSHTIYRYLDKERPATLSKKILQDLLRGELQYSGIIITDDLEMGAIENNLPLEQAAMLTLQAGADCLLICHDHGKVKKALRTIAGAIEKGDIPQEQLLESAKRIGTVCDQFAL